jgi:hypothetical protein
MMLNDGGNEKARGDDSPGQKVIHHNGEPPDVPKCSTATAVLASGKGLGACLAEGFGMVATPRFPWVVTMHHMVIGDDGNLVCAWCNLVRLQIENLTPEDQRLVRFVFECPPRVGVGSPTFAFKRPKTNFLVRCGGAGPYFGPFNKEKTIEYLKSL